MPRAAAAQAAIDEQASYAALVLGPGSPQLLISSASGASVARALEQAAEVSQGAGQPVRVVDLHPLPPGDPQGLVSFYVTIAASLIGFVTMFQLRGNAAGLSLRGWLATIAVLAIAGGLTLALVTDPLIGALRGPFAELWLAFGAEIAVAALFCSTMLVLIGHQRQKHHDPGDRDGIAGPTEVASSVAPMLQPTPNHPRSLTTIFFQISGKGAGLARTGLGSAAHRYASSEMPDRGKGRQSRLAIPPDFTQAMLRRSRCTSDR